MAAGVTDHAWKLGEVIALLDKTSEEKAAKAAICPRIASLFKPKPIQNASILVGQIA